MHKVYTINKLVVISNQNIILIATDQTQSCGKTNLMLMTRIMPLMPVQTISFSYWHQYILFIILVKYIKTISILCEFMLALSNELKSVYICVACLANITISKTCIKQI